MDGYLMEITVIREEMTDHYTGGTLLVDGVEFCKTLEDCDRELEKGFDKIAGSTAIPRGRYMVGISMSPRFGKELPILVGVPKFTGVRIHSGNTDEDTEGCILVGEWRDQGFLHNSRATMAKLQNAISKAVDNYETVYITVK
jgi:hypothetical protein